MAYRRTATNVRVSKRILWFDSEAYPLHNITRTNTLTLVPNRGLAIKRYLILVGILWIFAAIVASATPAPVAILVTVGALAWAIFKLIRLIDFLRQTFYELVIETAAGSRRALVSKDSRVVADLAFRITDAINNPAAEFQMRVENFHVGDNVSMIGDNNVGKVAP
jgi:hypothetical protein